MCPLPAVAVVLAVAAAVRVLPRWFNWLCEFMLTGRTPMMHIDVNSVMIAGIIV